MAYQHILVGVDLSHGERLVTTELKAANQQALETALNLAEGTAATITFCSCFDLLPHTQHLIHDEEQSLKSSVETEAEAALDQLVAAAANRSIKAQRKVVYGRPWEQLVEQVKAGGHDLLMLGASSHEGFERLILGSTNLKLLQLAPCAVWVTKPQVDNQVSSVLVATDLKPECQGAVTAAVQIAESEKATLHVLHAVQYPQAKAFAQLAMTETRTQGYQAQVKQDCAARLQQQVETAGGTGLAKLHLEEGKVDVTVLRMIAQESIELLVMSTHARSGVSGWLIGDTAERLLPKVPCSLLVVKP